MGLFQNPHFQTIFPALFRSSKKLHYQRKTILTKDDDFLDLDYYEPQSNSHKLAILIHGLEGNSNDSYITGTAEKLGAIGVNSLCMNLRSCSGRSNNLLKSYHSGKSEDLALVLESINEKYKELYLVGFSIGGNIALKYLGESSTNLDQRIKKAFSISPPLDLKSSANALSKLDTKIYMQNLLNNLKKKIIAKSELYPNQINLTGFNKIKNFYDYDSRYTAPLNGFKDAEDYWQKASSKDLLESIKVSTTILSSLDDPFLGKECFPVPKNSFIQTKYTQDGGHLGFLNFEPNTLKSSYLYENLIISELNSLK